MTEGNVIVDFTGVDIEDVAPEDMNNYLESLSAVSSEDAADTLNGEVLDDDNQKIESQPDNIVEQKSSKRKGWGERERDAKIEAQNLYAKSQEENIIFRNENEKLKNLLEQRLAPPVTQEDIDNNIDARLISYGLEPSAIVDKEAVLSILDINSKTNANVKNIENQLETNKITNIFQQSLIESPEASDAIEYYGQMKKNEAIAIAEQLGVQYSEEDAVMAAANKANELVSMAIRNGRNPAKALIAAAKALGYKNTLTSTNKINYNTLEDLRNSAGKPSIDTAAINSSGGSNSGNAYIISKGYDADAW